MDTCEIIWLVGNERIGADITIGHNLMSAAQDHNVPGIQGECGGCLSCATCHVVVHEDWVDRVNALCGAPEDAEDMMLEVVTTPRQPNSRLSCQLEARAELNGLVLVVPQE